MKNLIKLLAGTLISIFAFSSCGDDNTSDLNLNISGLENLGSGYTYEGWIIVDGAPVTTGTFDVNDEGVLSKTSFELDKTDLDLATTFVLTVEPSPDPDPAPSAVHILAGDISGSSANLTVGHGAALGNDFTSSTGGYILATPTDGGNDTNETSGVWFLDPTAGPGPSLDLPILPEGWIYEGWAVVDGAPVSTGRFTDLSGPDDFSGFSGAAGGPPFPGEDLLANAPVGVSFPADLSGGTVVISIEPVPDNSPNPFTLKPLIGQVPDAALDHNFYNMQNNAQATNPTGNISIVE